VITMFLIIQTILVLTFSQIAVYLVNGEMDLSLGYFISVFLSWLLTVWLTHPHKPKFYQRRVNYIIAPYIRGSFIFYLTGIITGSLFLDDDLFNLFVTYAFAPAVFFVVILSLLVLKKSTSVLDDSGKSILKYQQHDFGPDPEDPPCKYSFRPSGVVPMAINKRLEVIYGKYPLGFKVSENAQNKDWVPVWHTNVNQLTDQSILIIEDRLNDIPSLDDALRSFYRSMKKGGLLIINYHDIRDINRSLKIKYPGLIYYVVYPFHWIIYRVLSKVKLLSPFYKWLIGDRNKVMSDIEISGRLCYSGFDVESEIIIEDKKWIIARKVRTPSENPAPSFYILIQLNRVSLFGNIIRINKLRSMYPYSEFLQKKIYDSNQLGSTGKFQNDPRITPQGHIFRKYWIDELPQLLDWLRGEIKLVGIRAMSQHFFSLYDDEYKDLYYQVKPGIISPIFDEKTSTFNEIRNIEFEYLQSYLNAPVRTDWKYFWITFSHILKGVRSK
jgi:lipopolysaccharide/colanic/teichoic acid biosynthesis glycosyltransferase